MTDQSQMPTDVEPAEPSPADTEEHKFGEAAGQDSKQKAAEDDAAERLGNFA